jgi:hypothetical protein
MVLMKYAGKPGYFISGIGWGENGRPTFYENGA